MNRNYLLLLAGWCLFGTACKKSNDAETCLSFKSAPVVTVQGPATARVNENVPIAITFGCTSSCGSFGYFHVANAGKTQTIDVIARYEGCGCFTDAPLYTNTYTFHPVTPGTYTLQFQQGNGNLLTHKISVH